MKKYKSGFTLVELSIVIVIIGFLVAGIAAGSNLVKQAQMRSAISDFQSYQTSFNNFKGQYGLPPGDLNTAYSYWGTDCSIDNGVSYGGIAVCNGDGDGIVTAGGANPNSDIDEILTAWKHMELAKATKLGFADIIPLSNGRNSPLVPGSSIPISKLNGGGYIIAGSLNLGRLFQPYNVGFGNGAYNYLYLALPDIHKNSIIDAIMTAEEAFNLDLKMDDGIIDASGDLIGFSTGNLRSVIGLQYSLDNAGIGCHDGSTYIVSDNNKACFVGYKLD